MATKKGGGLPQVLTFALPIAATTAEGVSIAALPWNDNLSQAMTLYLAKNKAGVLLSDGKRLLSTMRSTGLSLRLSMVQQLINSFGLKLSDALMVFDDSFDEPLEQRVLRFAQCAIAIDGILRMWTLTSPARVDAPTEGEGVGYAGSELAPRNTGHSEPRADAKSGNPRKGNAAGRKRNVTSIRAR